MSPVAFAREMLGFEPDEKQARVLDGFARRVLLCCSRQWGKSTVTAVAAVHQAYLTPGSEVVVVGPSGRQSAELVRKARRFASKLGLSLRGDGQNRISLLFPNGSRMVGLPANEATVRGFSAVTLMLVDEAARVPDDLYEAVKPMLATTDGSLWLMSTPYGKRGFFYEEWVRGGDAWLRVEAPATECSRIPARFLEEERTQKGERLFSQEYLCKFVQDDDCMFREEDLRACMRPDLEPIF
jgi:Terminase large subunit, T4likevirus-type, N-terminal